MKTLLAFLLAFAGVGWLVFQAGKARHASEEGATVWFYDPRSHDLCTEPRETVPPDGDRVRAVVVAPRGQPREKKVAYLEMFGPALRDVLDGVRQARQAGRPYAGEIPARNSPFFLTNTLVRRVADADWVVASSAEGRRITGEWRSWRGADGHPWEVVAP